MFADRQSVYNVDIISDKSNLFCSQPKFQMLYYGSIAEVACVLTDCLFIVPSIIISPLIIQKD